MWGLNPRPSDWPSHSLATKSSCFVRYEFYSRYFSLCCERCVLIDSSLFYWYCYVPMFMFLFLWNIIVCSVDSMISCYSYVKCRDCRVWRERITVVNLPISTKRRWPDLPIFCDGRIISEKFYRHKDDLFEQGYITGSVHPLLTPTTVLRHVAVLWCGLRLSPQCLRSMM